MPFHHFPKAVRRWSACVISIAFLYLSQNYVRYHLSHTASQDHRAANAISAATDFKSLPQLELASQSPPTLDQLIASDPDHYPPWNGYKDKDYDPNRWHFLPLQSGYYECTVNDSINEPYASPVPYRPVDPLLQGNTCMGPRGVRLNESAVDLVHAYPQTCKDFPRPLFGSHQAISLDDTVCFDRHGRYGPYGSQGGSGAARTLDVESIPYELDWNKVHWGSLQKKCITENWNIPLLAAEPDTPKKALHRSAVLIRTWDTYEYEDDDLQAIRSLVSELSLQSQGQYEIFLFVHVKNNSLPIWSDQQVYDDVLRRSVPQEFRDMAVLWSEVQCARAYPLPGVNEVYWQQWQAMQLFAAEHREFDFFWNWEMDMRYIGHHLHFLSAITSFAAKQPRKYLWERSSRYYLAGVHGTWARFADWVASVVPPALSVWGPVPAFGSIENLAVTPSSAVVDDDFTDAVGAEADLISSLPFFNPENTLWSYRDKIWNFRQGVTTPRRVYINTFSRLSRKLLDAMDAENKVGKSMASEMWPATVALHYGLKAVYAPHPIWSSREWPPHYANSVFNIGSDVSPGSGQDAVYSPDREHNFGSLSWYFWSSFPGTLYRRFLGWDVADEFGHVLRLEAQAQHRMCLPAMLLHPVKQVRFKDRASFMP